MTDKVARALVSVRHERDQSVIQMPMFYPSGSSVVVSVTRAGDGFLVSDMGQGFEEAEQMGASALFSRQGATVAESAGVAYDRHQFVASDVDRGQLPAAVATVANCSLLAANLTASKLAERRQAEAEDRMVQRLIRVFGIVDKDVTVSGASSTKWNIDARVSAGGKVALFDAVSSHHSSIYSAVTKFHDIALLEDAPVRFAVVRHKRDLSTYLGVLSQAANVIEDTTPDAIIRRSAQTVN